MVSGVHFMESDPVYLWVYRPVRKTLRGQTPVHTMIHMTIQVKFLAGIYVVKSTYENPPNLIKL